MELKGILESLDQTSSKKNKRGSRKRSSNSKSNASSKKNKRPTGNRKAPRDFPSSPISSKGRGRKSVTPPLSPIIDINIDKDLSPSSEDELPFSFGGRKGRHVPESRTPGGILSTNSNPNSPGIELPQPPPMGKSGLRQSKTSTRRRRVAQPIRQTFEEHISHFKQTLEKKTNTLATLEIMNMAEPPMAGTVIKPKGAWFKALLLFGHPQIRYQKNSVLTTDNTYNYITEKDMTNIHAHQTAAWTSNGGRVIFDRVDVDGEPGIMLRRDIRNLCRDELNALWDKTYPPIPREE